MNSSKDVWMLWLVGFVLACCVVGAVVGALSGCGGWDSFNGQSRDVRCGPGKYYVEGWCLEWIPGACCACLSSARDGSGNRCLEPAEWGWCEAVAHQMRPRVERCPQCQSPCWRAVLSEE